MKRTSSIIPWKKDNLFVYNIRDVYFASLLSVLKKQDREPTRFEIARHRLVYVYRERRVHLKHCEHIHDQDSCQPRRCLSQLLPNYLPTESVREQLDQSPKAKLSKRKSV